MYLEQWDSINYSAGNSYQNRVAEFCWHTLSQKGLTLYGMNASLTNVDSYTLSCMHAMNLVLTFIINNVHCSTVWHSSDNPHCLHFWRHCQFSNEALNTLSGAVVDCAVLHCGHATAYLKNGMPLSFSVVFGAYTGDGCASTYNVSIQEMSMQKTAVFWVHTMACDSSYIQKMCNTWSDIKYLDRLL